MGALLINRDLRAKDVEAFDLHLGTAREHLKNLSVFYPDFRLWFENKVEPGVLSGDRSLLFRHVGPRLAGIAVVKHDVLEQKLCCLRVLPDFAGSGVGLRLFEDSFEVLKTTQPLLSVCEEQLPSFVRVFNHFGFRQECRYPDFYRTGATEHSYNGILTPPSSKKIPCDLFERII